MNKKTFAEKVIHFNMNLQEGIKISKEFHLLNPFEDSEVRKLSKVFYQKFYSDSKKRVYILGINPGRFGAGATGIPFTDPINLEKHCGISNSLDKRHELSSEFIYEMIQASGSIKKFYKRFFITAVCPLGFTKDGKNINYYDNVKLKESVEPFIIKTLKDQLNFGTSGKVALVLGEGKNYKYLSDLNSKWKFFRNLIPLPHPRFILQYKRKKKEEFINTYLEKLEEAIKLSGN